jgi:ABC-type multidrug transport system ATPase subunit
VELIGVSKRYGLRRPWVVRSVDLTLEPGTLVRVVGRNGSGKSTLLRLIAGSSEPSRGSVTGRPRTGFVPERFPPALPLAAGPFLVHVARVHGLGGSEARRRAGYWLERFGIAAYGGTPLRVLSKGTCQKLAIASALIAEPGLLVLDEAWTGLDQSGRATLDAEILERVAQGSTAVFVDHDPRRLHGRPTRHLGIGSDGLLTEEAAPEPSADPVEGPVVIEVAGFRGHPESLTSLPGVLAVGAVPAGLAVRVDSGCSDDVLRHLLAEGRVHVLSVAPATPEDR